MVGVSRWSVPPEFRRYAVGQVAVDQETPNWRRARAGTGPVVSSKTTNCDGRELKNSRSTFDPRILLGGGSGRRRLVVRRKRRNVIGGLEGLSGLGRGWLGLGFHREERDVVGCRAVRQADIEQVIAEFLDPGRRVPRGDCEPHHSVV